LPRLTRRRRITGDEEDIMVLPTQPSTGAECTCRHSLDCNCECHGRHCDPSEHTCSIEFLPDDGGLTPWGCKECTPGGGLLAHFAACPAEATVVIVVSERTGSSPFSDAGGGSAPSAH
jgi:hypothetical protein